MIRTLLILLMAVSVSATDISISNDTDVEDNSLNSANNTLNYGASTMLAVDGVVVNFARGVIRIQNISDSLGVGATNISCGCSLYTTGQNGTTADAYRLLKPWVEGVQDGGNPSGINKGSTWDDFSADNLEWGIAGADSADDAGVDNSTDGDDADRWETAIGSITASHQNYVVLSLPDSICQGWYDGTYNENGVILIGDSGADFFFNSIDNASNKPIWYFTYTTAGAGADISHVRRIKLNEEESR